MRISNKIYSKILLLLIIFGMVQCNYTKNTKVDEKNPYDVLDIGKLPIGFWVTPPDEYRNDAEYRKIANAGINFVNGFFPHENTLEEVKITLDLCQKNGLKYFVSSANVYRGIHAYAENPNVQILDDFVEDLKAYSYHPAYVGELLMDEPGKPLISSLAAFTKRFENSFPDKMWHVNLFPSYATGGIKTFSYEDYIDTWLKETDPHYLSYDSYPLLEGGGIIDDYYYNLDLIRSKTVNLKIPFWTFIQTLSIGQTPGVADKREPSEADIRWQVWSNLAFGAKGIQYFCYWSPGSGKEQFSDALIAVDGKETNKYHYVKKLNNDIAKIGNILLTCDAVGVIQTAKKPYKLYDAEMNSFGQLLSVEGDDNIVGCFNDNQGKQHLLVSPLFPDNGANVSLLLDGKVKVATITKGDTTQNYKVKRNRIELIIPKGEAVLVEF